MGAIDMLDDAVASEAAAPLHALPNSVTFDVLGIPAPQGSKKLVRTGGGVRMIESSKKVAPWRNDVQAAALDAFGNGNLLHEAVHVTLEFWVARPASAPKWRFWAPKMPDLDKLTRATLDGLTGIAFIDDGQVTSLYATKRYALAAPSGCRVTVAPLVALERAPAGEMAKDVRFSPRIMPCVHTPTWMPRVGGAA
jgi:crossover junction endodeoxyribonuclease RusA